MSIRAHTTLRALSGPRGETLAVLYVVLTWWWMVLLHQKCFFFFFNLLLLLFHSILRGEKQTWNLGNLFRLHTHSLIRSSPRWVSRHPAWAWISTSLDQPDVERKIWEVDTLRPRVEARARKNLLNFAQLHRGRWQTMHSTRNKTTRAKTTPLLNH